MDKISVPMAMVDLIPVILFFGSTILQLKAFYSRMNPANYAMMSAGAIMMFLGGLLKVVWKFLYALEVCDYALLSEQFFPMQALAFVLMAAGMIGMLTQKNKPEKLLSVTAVPLVTTHLPFLIVTFFGTTTWYACLLITCARVKTKKTMLFFILAYAVNMFQVVLAAKFDDSSGMHWLAEFANIIAQSFLLIGSYQVYRKLQETE